MTTPEGKLRLGGMALRNGLLIHGPTHWSAAVRTGEGELKVASGRKPRLRAADGIPGVRGVARLGEAFAVIPLVKRGLPEARLPFQDPSVLAVAAGASLGGTLLRRRLQRHRRGGRGGPRLVHARAVRAARRRARRLPRRRAQGDRRLRGRRGRRRRRDEGARALRLAPGRADARLQPRGHAAAAPCVEKPGPIAGGAVAIASTAAAVEVFAWCERNAETRAARLLRRPGFEIQRLVGTREPDERQLEVGRAALAEILRVGVLTVLPGT